MNKKLLWIPIGIIVVGLIIYWSTGKFQEPSPNFTAQVPNKETAVNKANIKSFELYIDFSGSMRGYVDFSNLANAANANSEMKSTITNFLDKVEEAYQVKTANYCGGVSYDKDVFRRKLQDGSIFNQGTTLLHEMIEENCAKANDTTLVAIVSDMVLSFGRGKLIASKDTFYNKNHLDDLSGAIHTAMTNLKVKGLDVVLLQYYSDFNGRYYYNYTENISGSNAYHGKIMKNRPYYILLAGKEDALKSILAKDCIKDAENVYASFGIKESDMRTVSCNIIQNDTTLFWTQGNDTTNNVSGFWTSDDLEKNTTKFNIVCSDFKIPAYLNKKSLSGYCSVGKVSSITYDDRHDDISFCLETKPFDQLGKQTDVQIEIKSTNDWKNEATTLDNDDVDKKVEVLEKRTWGFSHIIDAIDLAFHGKDIPESNVIGKFTFVLIKK